MYELIITEKPNAAKKIAEALADGKALLDHKDKVPFYKITRGKKDIVVACAVGHPFSVAEKEKSFAYPVFDVEWKPSADVDKTAGFSRKYLSTLKALAKDKKVSQDEERRGHDLIQKTTDRFTGKVDELAKKKEHEILAM